MIVNACACMTQTIQIAKFKIRHSPNLMLAKVSHYMVEKFVVKIFLVDS